MTEANLTTKRKIRAGHRTHTTKTIAKARQVIESFDENQISVLRSYQDVLHEKLELLQKLDEDILQGTKDDDLEKEIEDSGEFKRNIKECIFQIESVLFTQASESSTSGVAAPNTSVNKPYPSRVKLPKLHLKKFNGDPTCWQQFWESFNCAVHENTVLNSIDKFNYLLGLLENTALQAISGLSLSGDNYIEAVKILQDRFGNKQLIISKHMDKLLKLPSISSLRDVKSLRSVYDSIESNIRSLKSLGVNSEMYGSLLAPIMMSKLPNELRLIISRKTTSEIWDLDNLLSTFNEELQAREKCSFVSEASTSDNSKKPSWNEKPKPFTASSLFSGSGNDDKVTCTYCGQQHPSARCTMVTDIAARKAVLRQKGRCFQCLRSNHIIRDCTSEKRCFKCGQRHHTSICPKLLPLQVTSKEQESTKPEKEETKNDRSPKLPSTANIVCIGQDQPKAVLLQTASAKISSVQDPQIQIKARIMFDLGSQRTYISESLKGKLSLKTVRSDTLMIKTFGSTSEQIQECPLVECIVNSRHDNSALCINAYVVPTICAPLNGQIINSAKQEYTHLKALRLAEEARDEEELQVDVLIGADHYWDFVSKIEKRGDQGSPVATYTRLGWVLSGPAVVRESRAASINLSSTHVLRVETEIETRNSDLQSEVKKFWELESLGIKSEEESVYHKFLKDTEFKGERYEVKLPWKEENELLSDNYKLSIHRLNSQLRRLKAKPNVLKEYDRVINEQLKTGVIERESKSQHRNPLERYITCHIEKLFDLKSPPRN